MQRIDWWVGQSIRDNNPLIFVDKILIKPRYRSIEKKTPT